MTDGEGPVTDRKAAKARARAERAKPEHRAKDNDPRDRSIDADLADPGKQKGDD